MKVLGTEASGVAKVPDPGTFDQFPCLIDLTSCSVTCRPTSGLWYTLECEISWRLVVVSEVRVLVNKEDPQSEQIIAALEKNLGALQDVIKSRRVEDQMKEDELFGIAEVIGFVLLGAAILKLAKTAVEIVKDVLEIVDIARKPKTPSVVIIVDDVQLGFPASEEDLQAFLSKVETLSGR